ncbi:MAG: CYTH domain-containing protein [Candidatus Pacebacteria bacterium]|nr:CYTH domain-containing protein [Candidatus Paceibacterota bacterium]MDD2757241.1 CYTH domain-containing protein [Candidatus Paceibacterota bacterium]MDD3283783.1 CYTH domain-containing protein [Candidatus Paceibacterota bacterium]MDD3969989.1 CYTH domain-containing protein [Candidatus Paceibacterota bacterium]MDD4738044.1 CYTH domain-containing protein [Candidatus Paceibacterota bacterium]
MIEIEKKYLVRSIPDLSVVQFVQIEQSYLCISDEREVRLRKQCDKCFITVKSGGILERGEWESEISKESYESLFPSSIGSVIKDRYRINLPGGGIAELDIYRGNLEGPDHLTVEVEFSCKEEAIVFEKPNWFGKDITDDARYKNKNLAMNGWP